MTLSLTAVSDPTRRSILSRLAAGPATVGELARPFRITQQAVSKHLAYLERARLIEKRRDGRRHVCSLRPAPLAEIAAWTEEYRRFWDESFARLDAVLEDLKTKEAEHDR